MTNLKNPRLPRVVKKLIKPLVIMASENKAETVCQKYWDPFPLSRVQNWVQGRFWIWTPPKYNIHKLEKNDNHLNNPHHIFEPNFGYEFGNHHHLRNVRTLLIKRFRRFQALCINIYIIKLKNLVYLVTNLNIDKFIASKSCEF